MSRALADGEWCLPADCILVEVARLRPHVRRALTVPDEHYVLSRPNGRTRSVILDPDAAEFVKMLRRPRSVTAAIRTFAAGRGMAAAPLIPQLYPLLDRLRSTGLLVRPQSGTPILFRCLPGDRLGQWKIIRGVQVLEESEVYAAEDPKGRTAAVKVARQAGDGSMAAMLRHEADVLERLTVVACVPLVLGVGDADGHPFLAQEWRPGADALTAARPLRGKPAAVVGMSARIAQAYSDVHAAGVVHGDVHPKNVLVTGDGSVTILDFGIARVVDDGPGPARRGIGYFFEPELARALIDRSAPPPATAAGEVYGLAALLYLLMVGAHYCDFPLERGAFLAAVVEQAPVPWCVHGRDPWPDVEAALAAGLSKSPLQRPTAAQLAGGLETAVTPAMLLSAGASAEEALSAYLNPQPVACPPTSSLHFGSAGIAWALMRTAQTRSRADLLASAQLWAEPPGDADEHFYAPGIGITPASVGIDSLHHGRFGCAVVRSLVAHAAWDVAGLRSAVADVVAGSERPYERIDLVSGLAGVLLGLALVAEALPDDPLIDRAALLAAGQAVADRVEGAYPAWDSTRLGLAHGRAGVCYAQLRWAESAGSLPPEAMRTWLERLAADAEPADGGLAWPAARGQPVAANRLAAGWCNGAAGFALLFVRAARTYPSAEFERTALAAAETAWRAGEPAWNLCCGLAGRAYALLTVAAHTGEELWRERARDLAERTATPVDSPAAPSTSLYKGALGVHLLRADLAADPLGAAFPLCEPSGWARRTWVWT